MKRVLVAVALGGLLLVGAPGLASSAERNDNRVQATAKDGGKSGKSGGEKSSKSGGEKASKGDSGKSSKGSKESAHGKTASDNKGKDHKSDKGGDRGDKSHKGDKDRDHKWDRDGHGRHRHGHSHRYYRDGRWYYYYGPGYYGSEPYECYYGPSGAYNCEPYGGDYYGGGYHPGYGYGGYYGGQNRTVYVERHQFNPGEIRAYPGQEVLWVFRDSDPHTVTADNGSFDSGARRQGEFRLVFQQPGTYSYHCAVHPEMRGRVVVTG